MTLTAKLLWNLIGFNASELIRMSPGSGVGKLQADGGAGQKEIRMGTPAIW